MIFNFLIATLAIFAASCPSNKANAEYNPKANISAGNRLSEEEDKEKIEEALNRNNSLFITLLNDILYEEEAIDNIANLNVLIENGTALNTIGTYIGEAELKSSFLSIISNISSLASGVSAQEINKILYGVTKDDSLTLTDLTDSDEINDLTDKIFSIFGDEKKDTILKIMLEILKLIPIDLSEEEFNEKMDSIGEAFEIDSFYPDNVYDLVNEEVNKLTEEL